MPDRQNHTHTLEEKVFSLVRNLREYGNYNKSLPHATRLLYCSRPDLTEQECSTIMNQYSRLYDRISQIISENSQTALLLYQKSKIDDWSLTQASPINANTTTCRIDEPWLIIRMANFIIDWSLVR
ncbi:MAG TPA: hypothetical protein PKL83_06850 [bacterium]|nr:hypothetical protein [bacterium]